MVVDNNVTILMLAKKTLENSYDVFPFSTSAKALSFLNNFKPDLILLGIDMPTSSFNGLEMLAYIKGNNDYKDIPVVFLTDKKDSANAAKGFKIGAADYISTPFSIPLLLKRVEINLKFAQQKNEIMEYNRGLEKLVEEKTDMVRELQYAIIYTIAGLVEKRDGVTGGHIYRTKNYLATLLEASLHEGVYADELKSIPRSLLVQAAQLHDLGKISTPDSILLKADKLTFEEFEEMKKHTITGGLALEKAMSFTRDKDFLYYAKLLAISHHEKWDGTGYPYQLSGLEIPLVGRMMAIVDVYDALVSPRPYKEALKHSIAVDIIKEKSGSQFDPALVNVFLKIEKTFAEIAMSREP